VSVAIEKIVTAEATKVIEVLTATDEEVVAVFVSTRHVGQTSSLTYPATVADQMQTAPTVNVQYLVTLPINPSRHLLCSTRVPTPHLSTGK
jgi:hypothetical protein